MQQEERDVCMPLPVFLKKKKNVFEFGDKIFFLKIVVNCSGDNCF